MYRNHQGKPLCLYIFSGILQLRIQFNNYTNTLSYVSNLIIILIQYLKHSGTVLFPLSYFTLNPILFLFLPRGLSFPSIYIYLPLSFIQFFPILPYSCILFFPILPCQGIVSYFFLSYLELTISYLLPLCYMYLGLYPSFSYRILLLFASYSFLSYLLCFILFFPSYLELYPIFPLLPLVVSYFPPSYLELYPIFPLLHWVVSYFPPSYLELYPIFPLLPWVVSYSWLCWPGLCWWLCQTAGEPLMPAEGWFVLTVKIHKYMYLVWQIQLRIS